VTLQTTPGGCAYCGLARIDHPGGWYGGPHTDTVAEYTPPTVAQIKERMHARRELRQVAARAAANRLVLDDELRAVIAADVAYERRVDA
jgi:hypothetical protein